LLITEDETAKVSLGSREKGYKLNILENGRKGGHFGGARSPLFTIMLISTGDIRTFYAYTKRIDFLFFLWFFENQWLLDLVWGPGDRVMSSRYWKMGEKAIISQERVARSLSYYANFYRRYTGLLCLYETYRFSLFLWVFLKTKRFSS